MFYYDRGLKLTKADLAIDFSRRQPRGFISHAHLDHMARHEYALCTPATARLYRLRMGTRPVLEMPYRMPIDWGGLRLTTYPAGHCLGSAMLLAEDDGRSLLYTGDFKLSESATAERAELPHADTLVIESTYGHPDYRLIDRQEAIGQLLALVRGALEQERTPVIQAYALGKAQEVTAILTAAGFSVLQHPKVFEVSRVYEACGAKLGRFALYPGRPLAGHAVIVPPRFHQVGNLPGLIAPLGIAVTGWANDVRTLARYGVEHAVALSDHADYSQLLEAIDRVAPREIYCTHGPASFVDLLRDQGHNAFRLGDYRPAAVRVK